MTVAIVMQSDQRRLHQSAVSLSNALIASGTPVCTVYFHAAGVNVVGIARLGDLWVPLSGATALLVCSAGLALRGMSDTTCPLPFSAAGLAQGYEFFLNADKTVTFR